MVAEYQTALPPRALLQRKLHDLYAQLAPEPSGPSPRVTKASRRGKGKTR